MRLGDQFYRLVRICETTKRTTYQGIIRVVTGRRDQHDLGMFARRMLGRLLVRVVDEQDRPRDESVGHDMQESTACGRGEEMEEKNKKQKKIKIENE